MTRTTEPIRLLVVSDSLPERNGVGAYYVDLIGQLEHEGFACTLLCPSSNRGWIHLPLPGDATQRIYLPSPMRVARIIRQTDPHVIVVATPGPFGMMGARWSRRLNVPLLVGFHTHYAGVTDVYRNVVFRNLSRAYFQYVGRLLFKTATQVLGNSDDMLTLARSLGGQNVERIGTLLPGPVLNTPLKPHSGRIQQLLFAGRLAPEKRVLHVLETAEAMPSIDFAIAGDGPLRADVDSAAQRLDNVTALGWLSREQLMQQMDGCDALVMPSTLESFGTVALEAMARARLALVTDTSGIVNWPELRDQLTVFSLDTPLHSVLQSLKDGSSAAIQAQAEASAAAARQLNQTSLEHWIALLKRHAQ
ncbi:MAG: glycosyltransferase [Pseudomonadota bacterium]